MKRINSGGSFIGHGGCGSSTNSTSGCGEHVVATVVITIAGSAVVVLVLVVLVLGD